MRSKARVLSLMAVSVVALLAIVLVIVKYFDVVCGMYEEVRGRFPKKHYCDIKDTLDFSPNFAGEEDF